MIFREKTGRYWQRGGLKDYTHSHAINLLINPTVKSKEAVFNRKRQKFNKLWAIKAFEIHAVGKDVI